MRRSERLGLLAARLGQAGLTGRQRACLAMLYCDEMTHEEIGEHLGLRPLTVRRLLERARRTLSRRGMTVRRLSAAGRARPRDRSAERLDRLAPETLRCMW